MVVRFPRHAGYVGIGLQALQLNPAVPTHFVKWSGAPTQTPGQDFTRYNEGGDSQYPGITVKHLHRPDGSFECFARPDIAAFLFGLLLGKQVSTGAATAGASTTLNGDVVAGSTSFAVASAVGLSVGDLIQIGAAGSEEVREITVIVTNTLTVARPLARAHASGAAVDEVLAPVTHVFTPSEAAALPWASIERSIAGQLVNRFIDVRIQQINITGEAGQPITMTVNYLGITEERQVTPQTATYETNDPFIFWQGVYTVDGANLSAHVTNFSLQMINVFDEADQADAITRAHIPLIRRDIELTWAMKFETKDRYAETYLGGASGTVPEEGVAKSTGALSLDLTYGTGVNAKQLKVEIPAVYHTVAAVELDAGSTASQAYACEGHVRKDPAQELATVTVKNSEAEKYA